MGEDEDDVDVDVESSLLSSGTSIFALLVLRVDRSSTNKKGRYKYNHSSTKTNII